MSKKREEWGPHTHCVICGNAIPEGEKICSDECANKYEAEKKRYKSQQKMSYIFLIMMGAVMVSFLFLSYFMSGG